MATNVPVVTPDQVRIAVLGLGYVDLPLAATFGKRFTTVGFGAARVTELMPQRGIQPTQAKVLILGLAFKENCPDLSNTRVVDIVRAPGAVLFDVERALPRASVDGCL